MCRSISFSLVQLLNCAANFKLVAVLLFVIMGSPSQPPLETVLLIYVKSSPTTLISTQIPSLALVWKDSTLRQKPHGS